MKYLAPTDQTTDTIVALATKDTSTINIIRLSGSEAKALSFKLTSKDLIPRVASLCKIKDEKNILLDKCICIYYKAPFSFNGEDIVEFQCHGGFVVANEILSLLLRLGARLAEAGEFSKRAFLNGKLDLVQLESMAALVQAKSKKAALMLAENLEGKLSKYIHDIRSNMIDILARIEVMIDYSEEDLDTRLIEAIKSYLEKLILEFSDIIENSKLALTSLEGLKLAIIGKPNVGKSSLLNALLLEDRAIVSNIEGTTRDVISEYINIDGNLLKVSDTAGIHEGKDDIEELGIKKSLEVAKKSDIVLCVFDGSKDLDSKDLEILKLVSTLDSKVLALLNKNDLKPYPNLESRLTKDFGLKTLSISTNDIGSIIKLKHLLKGLIEDSNYKGVMLSSKEQSLKLEASLKSLQNALPFLSEGTLELASLEISAALKSLSSMTHEFDTEEMLDSMFSQFCVGK
ncbi:tRNA uridine-5-carboxymethylaminomethyl(34) synthesis GTPase MnmE [Helicobacter sp. 11S02629-2]|uniref:tRNA uridine-5-carboxymethylaminomethyl(34) synthesis GTPase MnmE n=1 Tax=Helicobacter sp. 11S02629-2 TaxID=1476195 RepID=UPI000BA74BE0|nr:tRNA uridine-5-carboxymethylaminomethyl(34) synthesis GTPase MnmE [Helicobacter sp. 11S02629-2]PAF44391.1 tRNA uridine-5-carboxymethylaminomethyl(34) synthesis GTPase MnmE [Helicobacter sp. 11S02629-2]